MTVHPGAWQDPEELPVHAGPPDLPDDAFYTYITSLDAAAPDSRNLIGWHRKEQDGTLLTNGPEGVFGNELVVFQNTSTTYLYEDIFEAVALAWFGPGYFAQFLPWDDPALWTSEFEDDPTVIGFEIEDRAIWLDSDRADPADYDAWVDGGGETAFYDYLSGGAYADATVGDVSVHISATVTDTGSDPASGTGGLVVLPQAGMGLTGSQYHPTSLSQASGQETSVGSGTLSWTWDFPADSTYRGLLSSWSVPAASQGTPVAKTTIGSVTVASLYDGQHITTVVSSQRWRWLRSVGGGPFPLRQTGRTDGLIGAPRQGPSSVRQLAKVW